MTTTDYETIFTARPLDGSSRFSLLGLLAGLYGLVDPPPRFELEPVTEKQRSLLDEYEEAMWLERGYSPDVIEEAQRRIVADDRELANAMFGERMVNAMFEKTGPVRITVTARDAFADQVPSLIDAVYREIVSISDPPDDVSERPER